MVQDKKEKEPPPKAKREPPSLRTHDQIREYERQVDQAILGVVIVDDEEPKK